MVVFQKIKWRGWKKGEKSLKSFEKILAFLKFEKDCF